MLRSAGLVRWLGGSSSSGGMTSLLSGVCAAPELHVAPACTETASSTAAQPQSPQVPPVSPHPPSTIHKLHQLHPFLLQHSRGHSNCSTGGKSTTPSTTTSSSNVVSGQRFKSQKELVAELIARGLITKTKTAEVMTALDRQFFNNTYMGVPPDTAYIDAHMPVGSGQVASAPSLHALSLDQLVDHLQPGGRALDVGTGPGYMSAALAYLAGPQGFVLAVEKHQRLADAARFNTTKVLLPTWPADTMDTEGRCKCFEVLHANALEEGVLAGRAPFDVIHVGASCQEPPQVLLDLLKPGGRMVLPIGKPVQMQKLTVVDKAQDGSLTTTELQAVKYMPLTPPWADKIW